MSRPLPTRRSAAWRSACCERSARTSRTRMADFAGGFMRRLGPWLQEHRIGRANLAAAFPEKSAAEIEDDPARRLGQSRPRRGRIRPYRPPADVRSRSARPGDIALHAGGLRAVQAAARRRQAGADLRRASRQLGAAGAASASAYRLDTHGALSRGPISARSTDAVIAIARGQHGHAGPDRPRRAAQARARRSRRGGHVAMLVDQYYVQRRRRDVLRPQTQGQSAASRGSPARSNARSTARGWCACPTAPLPRRADRGDRAARATPRARSTSQGTMQAITVGGRRLGARASRAMAVAAPALAVDAATLTCPVLILVHSRFMSRCGLRDRAR